MISEPDFKARTFEEHMHPDIHWIENPEFNRAFGTLTGEQIVPESVVAFTKPSAIYPGYVNIKRGADGRFVLTVRGDPAGPTAPGATATIEIEESDWNQIAADVLYNLRTADSGEVPEFAQAHPLTDVPVPQVPCPEGMTRYIGVKVIDAKPMDRLAYCHLRGWEVPADENPADLGYLVHYTDGGKPNVEGFPGYVSWSPADVFERAYREA